MFRILLVAEFLIDYDPYCPSVGVDEERCKKEKLPFGFGHKLAESDQSVDGCITATTHTGKTKEKPDV